MNPSLELSDSALFPVSPSPQLTSPMSQLTGGISEDMKAWFRSVDLSQMGVIDRMVFDINRRAILEKSRSKPALEKSPAPDSDYVFQRLLEDTHKRVETKKQVEEFHRQQELRPKTPKAKDGAVQAVYNRLQQDARARRESSITRMRLREAEERLQVHERQHVKPTGSVDKEQLVKRLTSDAQQRRRKAEEMRKEKEVKETEEARRLACLHHPKRKLDPNVMQRLTKVHRRQATLEDQTGMKGPPPKVNPHPGNKGKATPGLKRLSIKVGTKKEDDVYEMLRKAETQVRIQARSPHSPSFSFERNSSIECLPLEIEEPEWVQVSEHKEVQFLWKQSPVEFEAEEPLAKTSPSLAVKVPRLKLSEMKEQHSAKKVDLITRVLGRGNCKVNLS